MRATPDKKHKNIPEISPELKTKTPEELIHELQVHQIELETQAEELRRTQLALEVSRDQYLDLYDFAPLGYLTLTDEALVSQANLPMAGLLRIERRDLIGSRFRHYIVPEDQHIWDSFFIGLLRAETKLTTTLMLQKKDTSGFPARLEGIRLSGAGDGPPSIRVAVSDISDIRQAERARRESENLLKTVIQILPVGVLVLGTTGEIISNNPEAERIWGGTHPLRIGQPVEFRGWRLEDGARIHARDWAGARSIGTGEITLEEQIEIESPDSMHKIVLNSALPLSGSDGRICGAVIVTQDITEGKAEEEEIRWLASYPELNPNPVIEIDAEGTIGFVNRAALKTLRHLGFPNNPSVFLPGDKDEILRLLREGSEPQIEREVTVGTETFLENIALETGLQVIRIYARNITDRKRVEDALRERVKELNCLFNLSTLIEKSGSSLDAIYQGTVELIPAAWQYPEVTCARIIAGDREFTTPHFLETTRMLSQAISVHGETVGRIDVCDMDEEPAGGADPFLAEEQILLNAIAGRLGHVIERIRAEESLRESEEFNRNLVENLPDYIVVCGRDGIIFYANPATGRALGTDAGAVAGTSVVSYVTEKYRDQVPEKIRALLDGDSISGHEMEIIKNDGSRIPVILKGSRTRYCGSPAVLLLLTDITDRKKAELIISEQLAEITFYYDHAPVGLAVLDTSLRFLRINRMLAEINGIPEEEHIGKTVEEIIPSLAKSATNITSEILMNGQPKTDIEFIGETPAEPGVRHVWREGWFPVTDQQGKIIAFSVIVEDITERKVTEAALKESEERFRRMFSQSIVGKTITYLDGRMEANKAFSDMLGYSEEEFRNLTWREITHPDDLEESDRFSQSLISGERQSGRFSKRYLHKNGTAVWADVSATIERDNTGRPRYLMVTVSDITAIRQAEKAARLANKKLALLSSITRHDINNQLLTADEIIELLHIKVSDPALEDYFNKLGIAISRISSMIQSTK